MKSFLGTIALSTLSACSLFTPKTPVKTDFDLGPAAARAKVPTTDVRVVVDDVTAPVWMDNSSMYYRLAYRNADNPLPYRHSGWVMSPAALLTQRLRAELEPDTQATPHRNQVPTATLRGELTDFEQVFDAPGNSRGVLGLRAFLEGEHSQAKHTFVIERRAPTPDARGGVVALIDCSDELAMEIARWLEAVRRTSESMEELPLTPR